MNWLINALIKLGLLKDDLDYHLIRASMVVLFLFFGYQKWFAYEAQVLGNVPFLMKDVVPFAVSVYLLKQDAARLSRSASQSELVLAGASMEATR